MNDSQQLLFSVLFAAGIIQERLEDALAPTGLSLAKLGALRHLAETDQPLALGQLAERIACVKSNVTQLIDRLEADGMARRTPDPSDRRSVRAAITELGRQRYEAGQFALAKACDEVISELPVEEREALRGFAGRLTAQPA